MGKTTIIIIKIYIKKYSNIPLNVSIVAIFDVYVYTYTGSKFVL